MYNYFVLNSVRLCPNVVSFKPVVIIIMLMSRLLLYKLYQKINFFTKFNKLVFQTLEESLPESHPVEEPSKTEDEKPKAEEKTRIPADISIDSDKEEDLFAGLCPCRFVSGRILQFLVHLALN